MSKLCSKHFQPYTLYCNQDTCHRPICNACISLHPSHEIFNTQTFADYLSCVVENELKSYSQCVETLVRTEEEYGRTKELLVQNTVGRVKRIQGIVASIQESLGEYLKVFEEKAKGFVKAQKKVKEELNILKGHFEEKISSYNNTYEVILSKSQSGFNDLYQIWLYLNEQVSIELAQQEMPQVFGGVNYADPAASEISTLIVTLNNLQSNIASWTWIQGTPLLSIDANDDYWTITNQLKKIEEWCESTAEQYGKKTESLTITVEPASEAKEDIKYKCIKCKKVAYLNMKLTCGMHQLCFGCAADVCREKMWVAGGLGIDPRIECNDCCKTVTVEKMLLKECKCLIDCASLREVHKTPFEFEKKSIVFEKELAVRWAECPSGHAMSQEEIFYVWGAAAYSYFDSALDSDQLYQSLQSLPITDVWITKKKTTDEFSSLCFLMRGMGNIAHLTLRNQSVSTEEGLGAICSLLAALPSLRFLDLSSSSNLTYRGKWIESLRMAKDRRQDRKERANRAQCVGQQPRR
eukprot:TRINITY_DN6918_c0_g6_i2.p1 TRINITY_DN6918_c0_g6~~TRINITY_DN6918_c0_g6_i2.p1  ORF type:complete len:522 (+),score=83.02 TRINITY_DN6918_c0_g6_i2:150-1715(+)